MQGRGARGVGYWGRIATKRLASDPSRQSSRRNVVKRVSLKTDNISDCKRGGNERGVGLPSWKGVEGRQGFPLSLGEVAMIRKLPLRAMPRPEGKKSGEKEGGIRRHGLGRWDDHLKKILIRRGNWSRERGERGYCR